MDIAEIIELHPDDDAWFLFVGMVNELVPHRIKDHQRRGQATFNSVYQLRPDLADAVRTTKNDPFYRDERLRDFWQEVARLWAASKTKSQD